MSETYGSLLRKIRTEAGYSQVKFARMFGMSGQHLSAVEQDRRPPFDPYLTISFMTELGMDHMLDELLTLQADSRGFIEFDKPQEELVGECWEPLVKLRNKVLLGRMTPEDWEAIAQIVNEECHA